MSDDPDDDLDFSDENIKGTPPGPGFSGVRLFTGVDGQLEVWIFIDGRIYTAEPHETDYSLPLGFYDYDLNPVPDPAGPAGRP